ncbi:MAG: cytochrome c-type biogenesis protein CcmH [Rickettsiales bacterium]|jgi:cytochrome c-type biogenesis protein CcmH
MPIRNFILTIFLLFITSNSFAFSPEEHLPEKQEQRARELFLQIKCPVCAGQVIESSSTEVSIQLRKLVRQKIIQGKTDQEIKKDLATEYGNDILTSPPLSKENFLLWFLPMFFAGIGFLVIGQKFRKKKN